MNRKKIKIFFLGVAMYLSMTSQAQQYNNNDSVEKEHYWVHWLNDLQEMGVKIENDTLKFNEEVKKIIVDSNFRKTIYPLAYTWEEATALLRNMDFKKACWYLFNLYSLDTSYKRVVIKILITYDELIDMEKVMINTFYTYAILNPAVCSYNNGKPEVTRPDIVEKELGQLREMVTYIRYFRKERKEK